jgi:crotonobetainyl-CoA:carnitine CoA-transferase CaiB-like acyl-CoA transferase
MTAVLGDVRIVAIEQYGAGPYGTLHLAELGADIIKIEQPPYGDVGRAVPPYRATEDSLFHQSLGRSKRSVCLDISRPEGREVLEDLVRISDAIYSNLRGDVPARLGIRYADLQHFNPRIVCCSLSGYGMTGPRAAQPGFDYMVQGLAGWMSITGEPGTPPAKTGMSAVDFSAGLAAAVALLAGVHAARRDGVGADCDIALFDTALSMLNYLVTWTGTAGYQPKRVARSSHPTLVPFGNFPTADGWIVAGGSKAKFWERLVRALGLERLLNDPRLQSFEGRFEHRTEVLAELDAVLTTRTTAEWLPVLEAAGVPCAPVNSVMEALQDVQVVARDLTFTLDHPEFGSVYHVASPVRVGDGNHTRRPAPALGAHTRDVLVDLLGYPLDRVNELARAGVALGPGLARPASAAGPPAKEPSDVG